MQHQWEKVTENMQRLYVPGGWLVFRWDVVSVSKVSLDTKPRVIFQPAPQAQIPLGVGGMAFLPDQYHTWGLEIEPKEQDEQPGQKKAA